MNKKSGTPIVVVVNEGRYDVFGDADSFRHTYLKSVMEKTKRINDDVVPGIYHYNLERRGFKIYSTLKRVEGI